MMPSSSSSTPSTRVDWRARRIRSMLVARIGGPVVLWFGDFESNPSRARFLAPPNLPPDHSNASTRPFPPHRDSRRRQESPTFLDTTQDVAALHYQIMASDENFARFSFETLLRRKGYGMDVASRSHATLRRSLSEDDRQILIAL